MSESFIEVGMEHVKHAVFHQKEIIEHLEHAEKKILGHVGGKVKVIAQRSMKDAGLKHPVAIQKKRGRKAKNPPRGNVSPPGSPPYTHTKFLKNLVRYEVEPATHSVIIGPIPSHAKIKGIPGILEFGGTETITKKSKGGQGKTVSAVYKARPYMRPALDAITPTLPKEWAGAVSK